MMGLGDDILSVRLKASTSYQRGSAGFRSGLCADHSNSSTLDRINQLSSSTQDWIIRFFLSFFLQRGIVIAYVFSRKLQNTYMEPIKSIP